MTKNVIYLLLLFASFAFADTPPPISIFKMKAGAATGFLKANSGVISASAIAVSDIPLTFNAPLVNSSGTISCQSASGSQAGCLSASNWSSFNSKLDPFSVQQVVYVSKSGNDTTCSVGRIDLPCLTINKASAIITDATSSKIYLIKVGPGSYVESSLALKASVFIQGSGSFFGGTTYVSVSGGDITLDPSLATAGGRFGLYDLYINGSSGCNFDLQAVGGTISRVIEMSNVSMNGNLTFKANSTNDYLMYNQGYVYGNTLQSGGNLTYFAIQNVGSFTANTSGPVTAVANISYSTLYGATSVSSSGANTFTFQLLQSGTSTVSVTGAGTTFYPDAISIPLRGNLTVSSGATIARQSDAISIGYTPATSGNWSVAPTVLQDALDTLASTLGIPTATNTASTIVKRDSSGLANLSTLVTGSETLSTAGLKSSVADGASAVEHVLDTTTTISNAAAKLLSIRNNGTEKSYVDPNGGALFANTTTTGDTVSQSAVRAGNASSATNALLQVKNGHLKSTQTSASTVAVTANAGTSATCSISHGVDMAGQVQIVTGSGSWASGSQCDLTFRFTFAVAPLCILGPADATTASFMVARQVYPSASTTVLSFNFGSADASAHTYTFNYWCPETQ
jgi:hypothetical protein